LIIYDFSRCARCRCPNCLSPTQIKNSNGKKEHICHFPNCRKVYGKTSHLKVSYKSSMAWRKEKKFCKLVKYLHCLFNKWTKGATKETNGAADVPLAGLQFNKKMNSFNFCRLCAHNQHIKILLHSLIPSHLFNFAT